MFTKITAIYNTLVKCSRSTMTQYLLHVRTTFHFVTSILAFREPVTPPANGNTRNVPRDTAECIGRAGRGFNARLVIHVQDQVEGAGASGAVVGRDDTQMGASAVVNQTRVVL